MYLEYTTILTKQKLLQHMTFYDVSHVVLYHVCLYINYEMYMLKYQPSLSFTACLHYSSIHSSSNCFESVRSRERIYTTSAGSTLVRFLGVHLSVQRIRIIVHAYLGVTVSLLSSYEKNSLSSSLTFAL